MHVALTACWEGFIRQLIKFGRCDNASGAVRIGLRKLHEKNAAECQLAQAVRVPKPDDASS